MSARLALTLALLLALAPAAQARPNILVLETDDQTLDSMALHAEDAGADRRPGRDLHAQLRQLLALLPVALDALHRPVRPQPRRAVQQAADGRVHAPRHVELAAALASGGRLSHDARGQVPQRLRARRAARRSRPGSTTGTASSTPRPTATTATRSTRTASLRTHPGVYSTDFVTQRARDLIAAASPAARALVHVGRLPRAPLRAARASPTTRAASRRRRSRPSTPTCSRRCRCRCRPRSTRPTSRTSRR